MNFDEKLVSILNDHFGGKFNYPELYEALPKIKELIKSEMEKVIGKDLKGMTNRSQEIVLNDLKRIIRDRLSNLLK
jgi:hypothetical protein